jgi:tyrosyl-tRNA synthetase
MLTMDSVNTRLEKQQHLSFLEFNYMLLQAYDFLYLFENYNCRIQLGGADQWANMIFGVDLIRKKTEKLAFGMSVPLLLNSDGTKMGKTESGAIWLDSKLTSPFDFWQYWRNIDDKDVPKLMRLFTDVPVKEIDEYEKLVGSSEINNIKIILADAITSFVHEDADIGAINEAAVQKFHHITKAHNSIGVETFVIEKGTKIDQALVLTKLASSKTAGKRLIDGHAIKINDKIISDYDETIEASCIIFVGKKKFIHIKIHDV